MKLQVELDLARAERHAAILKIRADHFLNVRELDRERLRLERLNWEQFKEREAGIRARAAEPKPSLLDRITRPDAPPLVEGAAILRPALALLDAEPLPPLPPTTQEEHRRWRRFWRRGR